MANQQNKGGQGRDPQGDQSNRGQQAKAGRDQQYRPRDRDQQGGQQAARRAPQPLGEHDRRQTTA